MECCLCHGHWALGIGHGENEERSGITNLGMGRDVNSKWC